MAFIGTIASDASSSTPAGHLITVNNVPLTVNTTIGVGKTLIGTIVVENGAGSNPPIGVTDSTGSNTYSVDKQINDTPTNTTATTIFSCRVTTQINSGATITVRTTDLSTRSRWAVSIQAFDDILSPRLDQTASNTASNATVNSGTTPTTTAANELIYAGFGSGVRTFTAGSGYTAVPTVSTTAGSTERCLNAEWKYVTATGTQTATGTLSSSSSYTGAIATYKSASANQSPTANAGTDQNVTVSTTVTLDGSGSSDPDGTIASYAWTQISGTSVTLSSSTAQKPTFTAPASAATLVFGLTVTDNLGATSSQDTVTINVGNKVGFVAEAATGTSTTSGPTFQVSFNKTVSAGHTLLIGLAVDAPGTPPESDSSPVLSVVDTKSNTYTVHSIGYRAATVCSAVISAYITTPVTTSDSFTITCTTDRGRWAVSASEFDNIHQNGFDVGANNSDASTTSLLSGTTATTQNQTEVIFASFGFGHSTSQTLTAGTHYTLAGTQQNTGNASGHRAVANEYRVFTAATTHEATATLSGASGYSAAIATFAADLIADQIPVANAGPSQTVAAFDTVTLDGTGSTDEDGFVTGYSWTQTAGPAVSLSSSTAAQPTFTAPAVNGGTSLTFSLVVTDNLSTNSTNSATVTITVNSAENFVAHSGSWTAMQELAAHAGSWS